MKSNTISDTAFIKVNIISALANAYTHNQQVLYAKQCIIFYIDITLE